MESSSQFRRLSVSHRLIISMFIVPMFVVSGCVKGPGFFKQDDSGDGTIYSVTTSDLGGGKIGGTISAGASVSQQLSAGSDSSVAGTSVTFPPGSLGVSTSVTVEGGASIARSSVGASLGIGSISAAGPAAVVLPGQTMEASAPFTIALPLSSSSLRLADIDLTKLVVIYKGLTASGEKVMGVIGSTEIEVSSAKDKVSFKTTKFGQFQVALVQGTAVTASKEIPSKADFMTETESKALAAVSWSAVTASYSTSTRKLTGTASVTGMKTLGYCAMFSDGSKSSPIEYMDAATVTANVAAGSHDFAATASGAYAVAFECEDADGRIELSGWSDAATIASTATSTFSLSSYTPTGVDVDPFATPTLTFSKAVSEASIDAGLKISCAWCYYGISGSYDLSADQTVVTLYPDYGLALHGTYTVEATSSFKDTSGSALTNPTSWQFTTADGLWDAALTSIETTTATRSQMQIARNDAGQAVAAWFQGGPLKAYARYFDGTSWSSLVSLNASGSSSPDSLRVAIDNFGNAYVSFGQDGEVWVAQNSGSSMGTATNLSSSSATVTFTYPDSIELKLTPNGLGVIAYVTSGGSGFLFTSQLTTPGGTFAAPYNVEATAATDYSHPSVDICNSGKIVVAWEKGTSTTVTAAFFDGSTWGASVSETPPNGTIWSTKSAVNIMADSCHGTVSYGVLNSTTYYVKARQVDGASGTWGSIETITSSSNPLTVRDVVGRGEGRPRIFYSESGTYDLYQATNADLSSWDAPTVVVDETVGAVFYSFSSNEMGDFAACYATGGGTYTHKCSVDIGGGWTTPLDFNTGYSSTLIPQVQIGVDPAGNIGVAWNYYDAGIPGHYVGWRRFDRAADDWAAEEVLHDNGSYSIASIAGALNNLGMIKLFIDHFDGTDYLVGELNFD